MQNKFINNHRQKRKYKRKTQEISSFSLSKTLYGMLPLIVMLVAFMSTIVISAPFRNSLANIQFTFEPPQISLDNPLSFIQSLSNDTAQLGLFIWTIMLSVYRTFSFFIIIFFSGVMHTARIIQNNVVTKRETTFSIFLFLGQEVLKGINGFGQVLSLVWHYCITATDAILIVITHTIIYIGQIVASAAIAVTEALARTFIYLAHLVVIASLTVFSFITVIVELIWSVLTEVGTFIATTTQHVLNAIVYFIELPFKIIYAYFYAFWLHIKPYTDILGKHVEMTGDDLANGISSMGKVASLMGASK